MMKPDVLRHVISRDNRVVDDLPHSLFHTQPPLPSADHSKQWERVASLSDEFISWRHQAHQPREPSSAWPHFELPACGHRALSPNRRHAALAPLLEAPPDWDLC